MPHDELHESPLSPADDERIRRLLREARHTEPVPEDVAARLDGVLSDLVAERAERDAALPEPRRHEALHGAPVVDLAARRRRTAANLLIAAAAVVVLGVGVSQVLPQGAGDGDAMTGSADQAEAGDAGGSADLPEPESAPGAPADSSSLKVRSKRFGADVRKIQVEAANGSLDDAMRSFSASKGDCLTTDPGPGELVSAMYDGTPAVVLLRVPSGDVQVVDLYLCGDTEPRRTITLTVP